MAVQGSSRGARRRMALCFLIIGLALLFPSALALASYLDGELIGGAGSDNPQGLAQTFAPSYRTLEYRVYSRDGRNFDAFLMNQSEYRRYQSTGSFDFIPAGSVQGVTDFSALVRVEGREPMVLLVLDSDTNPYGTTHVTMEYYGWTTPLSPAFLEALAMIGFIWSFAGLAWYIRELGRRP